MRTIRNLSWFFLAFVLTVWAGVASAQDYYWGGSLLGGSAYGKEPDEACLNVLARGTGYSFTDFVLTSAEGARCYAIKAGVNNGNRHNAASLSRFRCPKDRPFFVEDGCRGDKPPEEPPKCEAGSPGSGTWPSGDRDKPAPSKVAPANIPGCIAGCAVMGKDVQECKSYGSNPTVYCSWATVTTGARCVVGDETPGTSQPPTGEGSREDVPPFDSPGGPCPRGSVQAGVNSDGVPRCIGSGSDPKNSPPKPPTIEKKDEQQNPDGSTTTTTTTTTSNADGSTTTVVSKTTTGTDGNKTTTESRDTTKSPTGNAGKDDSKKDEEKYDLCKQNPHLTICKNSSVAGTCGQVSCDGDAIQCATLRAAAAMQCKQQENEDLLKASPLTAKGNAAINGSDLEGLPSSKNAEIVNIPTLGAQGWLGNGAAFRDVSITVQGKQIVVPLSKWSDYLLPFRYIMMIIASLISYKILAGAITRS